MVRDPQTCLCNLLLGEAYAAARSKAVGQRLSQPRSETSRLRVTWDSRQVPISGCTLGFPIRVCGAGPAGEADAL